MSDNTQAPQVLPTHVRLVGGPPMWDGTTLTPQAADIDDLYAILQVTDGTQLPKRSEDEDTNPCAVYGPIPESTHPDDLAEWYFRGWWPHSPTDPSPRRYLVAHLVHKATQAEGNSDIATQARGWLDRNHRLMLDLADQSAQASDWDAASLLHESLHTYLSHGEDLALAVHNAERAVTAARALGQTSVLFDQLTDLASAHRRYGDHAQAIAAAQQALDLDGLTPHQKAHAQYTLGMCLAWNGQHARALEVYERVHTDFDDLEESLQAAVTNALAWSLSALGRAQEALMHAQRAVELAREHGDGRTLAAALDTLGHAQAAADEPQRARAAFQEALELYRSIGYQVRIDQVLDALNTLEEQD